MQSEGGASRDLELAKKAYKSDDVQLSKLAHDGVALITNATESHKTESGKHIKAIVFGGLDGIITTFAVVAGVAGADLSSNFVLVLGFASLLADAVSMGFGEFISAQAETDYQEAELKRERWEMENYPEGEVNEMVEIYIEKGFSKEDAETIIKTMAKNTDFFVSHMLVQELGIMPPDDDDSPLKSGLITFCSFIVFGFIPLLAFLIMNSTDAEFAAQFGTACALTAATLIALGVVKAKLSGMDPFRSALKVLFNGTLAAVSAYLIGWALSEAFPVGGDC